MKYPTSNLHQAATLWANLDKDQVQFAGLEPTDRVNNYNFVFKLEFEKSELDQWILDFDNNRLMVEPNTYKDKWNKLKDNLSLQTGRGRQNG